VIQALDGSPISGPDDLQPLVLTPPAPGWTLKVRRARRTIGVTLDAAPGEPSAGPEEGEGSGVRLASPANGYPVESVLPGSRGDEAGIRPGDRVVRIDQVPPRSAAEVRRALAGKGPVFLELERGRRRLGVLLDSR
jgi:S1-C subfamily serine protease